MTDIIFGLASYGVTLGCVVFCLAQAVKEWRA
jgi:hypothetical protein